MQLMPTGSTSAPSYMYDQPGDVRPTTSAQPTQWVVVQAPGVVNSYKHSLSKALGSTLIVTGALSIIFNIVDLALTMYGSIGFVGHGFWSGGLCIIAGGFGVAAGANKTVCMIRAFMVLSIIAACTCLGQLIAGTLGAVIASYEFAGCTNGPDGPDDHPGYIYYDRFPCAKVRTLVAMESLLAVLAVVGGVAAIWGSALCCKVACCCGAPLYTYGPEVPMTVSTQQQQQQHQHHVPTTFSPAQLVAGPSYQYNGAPVATSFQKTNAPIQPASSGPPSYDNRY